MNIKIIYMIITIFCSTVSTLCLAQEKPSSAAQRDSIILAARELIGAQKYCAIVTIDSSGRANIRTMNPFPPEDDMTIWIATNSRSRKVKEIRNNPNVVLYYANHAQATGYVAITGRAVLVDDMEEKMKRKRDYWAQAFPDWKYLMLIKVIPEKLEVINYRHGLTNGQNTWDPPSAEFK
jgi:general stress protein 26